MCVGLRKRDSTLNELHSFGQVAYAGKCARVMMFDLFSPRPMWTLTPKVTVVITIETSEVSLSRFLSIAKKKTRVWQISAIVV